MSEVLDIGKSVSKPWWMMDIYAGSLGNNFAKIKNNLKFDANMNDKCLKTKYIFTSVKHQKDILIWSKAPGKLLNGPCVGIVK